MLVAHPLRSLACSIVLFVGTAVTAGVTFVPFGSGWRYLDDGTDQGTAWRTTAFNDAGWSMGLAELGYGDGDESTVVGYGPNASAKYVTTYFRRTFTIPDPTQFTGFLLRFRRDDGMVLYINGVEAVRSNMPTGTIGHTTLASSAISGSGESTAIDQSLPIGWFQPGTNTIAVEIHQNVTNSSDITFDLQLTGVDGNASLVRGPYQHIATPTSIVFKWRTDIASSARVRYGTLPGALTQAVTVTALTLDHEMIVNGLLPNTTYYYAVGTAMADLEGDDTSHFFRTSPLPGLATPLRIWVVGDAGTANTDQRRVRTAYLNSVGPNTAQAWLWLGDNAYASGTEAEFQAAVFENMYEPVLRNTTLWPCPGNHDYYSGADATTGTGPYFDLFALPTNGQSGGVASNTEAYYSYDIGNVHFISLDSYDSPRSPTGAMANWLTADLAFAHAKSEWIIAYWHHPPYSKGSNNSDDPADSGGLLQEMRQNILPILEAGGVDLVLCGHSHTYERSRLIDGHYGVSSTFNPATMGKDMTSGRADGTGAYQKPGDLAAHAGAVYAVCGVSGKKEPGGPLNHPVMYMSTAAELGSMVIDVDGTTLSARFINDAGAVIDHFDMVKGATHVSVALKVLIEGALGSDALMRDDLRGQGLLPMVQPHTGVFPLVGEGGLGQVDPSVLNITGPDAIVDWVFVELRDPQDPAVVVDARSALLQRDGDVVDEDGLSPLRFAMPVGGYHVAIRHRNHLGAMTALPVFLDRTPISIDFRSASTATWGTNARKDMGGTLVLRSGNCVIDGRVKYTGVDSDRDAVLNSIGGSVPTNTVGGYRAEDLNLDGLVKYTGASSDRDLILTTIGGAVPTNTVEEQLP